ncbi:MAG: dimethylhistidine N-methyltransferase [Thiobacillus sp. 65-29]|mgnify:CR=1 FL=1|nr:MAG: dimethylhistidine N-methyltransferase [Thiobacillus sp. 65-29]
MRFSFQDFPAAQDRLRADVLAGLATRPKSIPPKYFYDAAGCHLFETICTQPEYALCRTEQALMASHLPEIATALGKVESIVEPGAGDCTKVRRLLDALRPNRLVVMDIAGAPLAASAQAVAHDYPDIDVSALAMDFLGELDAADPWLAAGPHLVYYPGSSIGNFPPAAATALLARFRRLAGADGRLLIGFDLKKDPQRLHAAYNDAAGVTAAFNLNLLARINRELAADFDLARFRHYAFYNPLEGRVEMHLASLTEQTVNVAGQRFRFDCGETLLTEYSYKFVPREFDALAQAAGWQPKAGWQHDGFAVRLYE